MTNPFNIRFHKVGGIYWLHLGRINISFCVTSRTKYARKQHAKAWQSYQQSIQNVLTWQEA